MRKLFLLMSLIVFALMVEDAMASNTWQQTNGPDTVGMEGAEFDFTGALTGLSNKGDARWKDAGYDIDGKIATAGVLFDTDKALDPPIYTIPCPKEQIPDIVSPLFEFLGIYGGCSEATAAGPQTDDVGSSGYPGFDGLVLDDLFTYVEDYTDDTSTGKHHIAQPLDILFYVNAITTNDPGAANGFSGANVFKEALAIGQTLEQDIADFSGTSGPSPYTDGILAGIYQQFEMGDEGHDREQSKATGKSLETSDVGLMDQMIWQELADIESGSGTQGILQKYVSLTIVGDGGDLCDVINVGQNCIVTNTSDHESTKNIGITDKYNINEAVHNDVVKSTTGP